MSCLKLDCAANRIWLQVVLNLAERLLQLHGKGLVHRDLKPANVLWRTSVFEWTLIDFGCAAEAGVHGLALESHLCVSLSWLELGADTL